MKKSVIFLLVTIFILMVALPSATMAKRGCDEGRDNGRRGNSCQNSEWAVDNGPSEKELKKLEKMVAKANRTVDKLVARAQATPYNDIAWLLREVEKTVRPAFEYGEEIGVTVICEMVEYYIDGEYVLVDPLRVVSI